MSSYAAPPSSVRQLAYDHPSLLRPAQGVVATLVVALAAHIAMPLPFTPVPFTLQPLAVLAVGLLLGPVDGALVMLAYLAEGAAGLPVFSPTGPGGLLQLLGPTGGFLLAYPLVAAVCGGLVRLLSPRLGSYLGATLACTVATLILFAAGAAWLAHLLPLGPHQLWIAAVAPFLPGEAIKILIASGLYRSFYPGSRR